MNRAHLVEKLALIEQHIARADVRIGRQRDRVDELERGGLDSSAAKATLASFLGSQKLRFADRARILAELAS